MQFLIDRINQIISLSDDEAQLIKQLFTVKEIKKREHFLRESQVCGSVAIIRAGLVRMGYGWIKGIRDIFSGLVVLLFLISRKPRATAFVFGGAIIIPVSDCLTVLAVNGPHDVTHLLIHGITAVYMLITTLFLFQAAPKR